MKNKKAVYMLLPAVVLVWALIGYRMWGYFKPPEFNFSTPSKIEVKSEEMAFPDTFQLRLDYRDPFSVSGGNGVLPTEDIEKKVEKQTVQSRNYVRTHWPKVLYLGWIKGKNGQVAILRLKGKERIMREGQEADGFRLIWIKGDSVRIAYQEQERVFKK